MKLAIIIPAYNEEKSIESTLRTYEKFFKKIKKRENLNFNLIVVINNTTDRTLEIVDSYSKSHKEINYLNFKRGGKGFAIVEGFKYALKKDFNLIGFVDADMSTNPNAFFELVKNINGYGGIIASRWVKGSIIKSKQTLLRRITSRGFNFIVRSILFLPYKDTQCGAKLFKREAIRSVINELGITNWAFDIDLIYKIKRRGFKIIEIPTTWEEKRKSKLNIAKVPFQMFSAVIRLRLIYSPFNFIVKLYNKLPEIIKIHNL